MDLLSVSDSGAAPGVAGSNIMYTFTAKYQGLVKLTAGTHVFATNSDDGSKLWIDDSLVVDNDGNHGDREIRGNFEAPSDGLYKIYAEWY